MECALVERRHVASKVSVNMSGKLSIVFETEGVGQVHQFAGFREAIQRLQSSTIWSEDIGVYLETKQTADFPR